MLWALVSSLVLSAFAIAIYLYFLRKGQFDNDEDVKYQMFRKDSELEE